MAVGVHKTVTDTHTYIHTNIHTYIHTCIHTYVNIYCIAGNFWGRKLANWRQIRDKYDCCEETVRILLLSHQKMPFHQILQINITQISRHKTVKVTQVFSLESFSLCGTTYKHNLRLKPHQHPPC